MGILTYLIYTIHIYMINKQSLQNILFLYSLDQNLQHFELRSKVLDMNYTFTLFLV